MTSSHPVVQLLVLLAVCFVLLKTFPLSQDSKEVALLKQMRDWGKGVHDAIRKNTTEGQYLVAALVSDVQAESPDTFHQSLMKGCPPEPDAKHKIMKCSTSAVILNRSSKQIWRNSIWRNDKTYRNHPWHGEYRLLHDGILESLLQNFWHEKRDTVPCRLMLYSFYIPCADVPNTPYSCSELIADYNSKHLNCKVDITGYTKVFEYNNYFKTNEEKAVDFLAACRQLKDLNDASILIALKEVRNAAPAIFQEQLFDCIMNSPLSSCCIDTNNESQRSQVVSFFVNTLLNEATDIKSKTEQQFNMDKNEIETNIDKLLENKSGTDCYECLYNSQVAGQYHRYFLAFCTRTALDLSDTFGLPIDSLLSGKWERVEGSVRGHYWDVMHYFLNIGFRGHLCIGNLDPSSLCTKTYKKKSINRCCS